MTIQVYWTFVRYLCDYRADYAGPGDSCIQVEVGLVWAGVTYCFFIVAYNNLV
jgi:hypothetical protein